MAGIYIHIPFCKQACHYCDFHFSTSLSTKKAMVLAIAKELVLRKDEYTNQRVETIYFGGGTPSLLELSDINFLITTIYTHYSVITTPEITLEANPDDLTPAIVAQLAQSPINRLSIGIQSFFTQSLTLINRAHTATQAIECLKMATTFFDNISIDLIYGIPGMTNQEWVQNIEMSIKLGIPHISSYALTVEPKTALSSLIKKGKIPLPDDAVAHQQFLLLVNTLTAYGYIHYELSNFGKPNYFSKNNSGYWLGKQYLGVGPSAHSYNGTNRSWNIANNILYIKAINQDNLPQETEILTIADKYNEYVMTGLRTIWGVSMAKIVQDFGEKYQSYLLKNATPYLESKKLILTHGVLKTTIQGKFFADGIASDLFWLNLE